MPATPPRPDRRVTRTQKVLLDALFELIVERGYERLTIQNLLDRADVGRATFYAHFSGKDELLACSVARLHRSLARAAAGAAPDQPFAFTLPFFEHLASHRRLYHTVIARRSEVTVEWHVREMLAELIRADLAVQDAVEPSTQYLVGALWSMAVWWIGGAEPLPPAEVDALFRRLALQGCGKGSVESAR
jgi:AcrR family transcriptional regulator